MSGRSIHHHCMQRCTCVNYQPTTRSPGFNSVGSTRPTTGKKYVYRGEERGRRVGEGGSYRKREKRWGIILPCTTVVNPMHLADKWREG